MHDSQGQMFFVMLVLMIFSIFFGYIFSDTFVGIGSLIFSNTIFLDIHNYALFDAEFGINILFKFFPLFFSLFNFISESMNTFFNSLTSYMYFHLIIMAFFIYVMLFSQLLVILGMHVLILVALLLVLFLSSDN